MLNCGMEYICIIVRGTSERIFCKEMYVWKNLMASNGSLSLSFVTNGRLS